MVRSFLRPLENRYCGRLHPAVSSPAVPVARHSAGRACREILSWPPPGGARVRLVAEARGRQECRHWCARYPQRPSTSDGMSDGPRRAKTPAGDFPNGLLAGFSGSIRVEPHHLKVDIITICRDDSNPPTRAVYRDIVSRKMSRSNPKNGYRFQLGLLANCLIQHSPGAEGQSASGGYGGVLRSAPAWASSTAQAEPTPPPPAVWCDRPARGAISLATTNGFTEWVGSHGGRCRHRKWPCRFDTNRSD